MRKVEETTLKTTIKQVQMNVCIIFAEREWLRQ